MITRTPKQVTSETLIDRQVEAVSLFCGGKKPQRELFIREEWDILQDWINDNLAPEFSYATALSVMESASAVAESQIENGMEELLRTET